MHFAMDLYRCLIRVTFAQSCYTWSQTREVEVKPSYALRDHPLPDSVRGADSGLIIPGAVTSKRCH